MLIIQSDVTLAADRARIVSESLEKFGHIDILVNNAGISRKAPLLDYGEEEWRQVMNTNLDSCFFLAKAVIPHMRDNGWGRIINITSVVAQTGNPGQANYIASKAGLIGLTKAVAQEVASRSITVNAVAPGFIATAMTEKIQDAARERLLQMIPLGRMGSDRDVAVAVRFLASEEAGYITGHVLNVNGGMFMG
jgi:3-oxoacyl-[acyl-carrier protein] reductase